MKELETGNPAHAWVVIKSLSRVKDDEHVSTAALRLYPPVNIEIYLSCLLLQIAIGFIEWRRNYLHLSTVGIQRVLQ